MPDQPSQLEIHKEIDAFFESFDGRRESAKTLLGFSLVYLTGYFTDPPASFHSELIHALESDDDRRLLIIGFRAPAKARSAHWHFLYGPHWNTRSNIPSSSW
jgi:hypothetical protein